MVDVLIGLAVLMGIAVLYEVGRALFAGEFTGFGNWLYDSWQRRVACFQHNMGVVYSVDQDRWAHQKAVELLRKALAKGYTKSYQRLGEMYEHGLGIPQDLDEAHRCYEEAFYHGDIMGVYCLVSMYANGETRPRDDEEATKWFRIAAKYQ